MSLLSRLVVPAPIQAAWGLAKAIPWQVWALAALLALGAYYGHTRYNAGQEAQKRADAKLIAGKDAQLLRAGESLRTAGKAIRDINARAAARLAEEALARKAAEAAGTAAAENAARLQKRVAGFGKELESARRKPTCAALLDMDVAKECGL